MTTKALGLIGIATKAGKITIGTEAVLERIEKKKTYLVIMAKDASNKAKENMGYACKKNGIHFLQFESVEALSHWVGKSNKSVICINEKNLGEEIYKIISGGEAIG